MRAAVMAVGSQSWFQGQQLEAERRNAGAEQLAGTYPAADELTREWNTRDRFVVGAGASGAALGVIAAVAGVAWGVAALGELPDSSAE
jgi:alkyl hydroperoxide reductase subunit AhpF